MMCKDFKASAIKETQPEEEKRFPEQWCKPVSDCREREASLKCPPGWEVETPQLDCVLRTSESQQRAGIPQPDPLRELKLGSVQEASS